MWKKEHMGLFENTARPLYWKRLGFGYFHILLLILCNASHLNTHSTSLQLILLALACCSNRCQKFVLIHHQVYIWIVDARSWSQIFRIKTNHQKNSSIIIIIITSHRISSSNSTSAAEAPAEPSQPSVHTNFVLFHLPS